VKENFEGKKKNRVRETHDTGETGLGRKSDLEKPQSVNEGRTTRRPKKKRKPGEVITPTTAVRGKNRENSREKKKKPRRPVKLKRPTKRLGRKGRGGKWCCSGQQTKGKTKASSQKNQAGKKDTTEKNKQKQKKRRKPPKKSEGCSGPGKHCWC